LRRPFPAAVFPLRQSPNKFGSALGLSKTFEFHRLTIEHSGKIPESRPSEKQENLRTRKKEAAPILTRSPAFRCLLLAQKSADPYNF